MRPPVLGRRIVPSLTARAGERDDVAHGLLRDLRDHAGAHRPPPPPNRKPQPTLPPDQPGHADHPPTAFPLPAHTPPLRHRARPPPHTLAPQVKLRLIPVEKRRLPPPLVLAQHVHLGLELLVRLDRPRLRQHLPPLHFILIDPPQQRPDVVPRLPLVQQLPKHLHPRHHRLPRLRLHPHDLDLFPHLHHAPLHPPRDHRPPPRDREYVLDRHQKRLVHRPRRRRNVAVHRLHQLPTALRRLGTLRLLP